ncbi:MAG: leucine-rich repeat domain-containing protein [Promethearchaeota archaeon]
MYKGKRYKVKKNKLKLRGEKIIDIAEIEGLGELTDLKELDLSKNEISEIKGLETLKNLKILKLNKNNIKKLGGLQNLFNLEELWLNYNKINKIEGLNSLTNLRKLVLSMNLISEIEGLDNLTNLISLDIKFNPFHEIKGLENLINLRELDIGFYNTITNTGVKIGTTRIPEQMLDALEIKIKASESFPRINVQKLVEYCCHKKEHRNNSPYVAWYDFKFQ